MPWQSTQCGASASPRAIALPCSELACCLCSSLWQVPHCTRASGALWGRSLPSRSAWQLVQESAPCTEDVELLAVHETAKWSAPGAWWSGSCRRGRRGSRRWRHRRPERRRRRPARGTVPPMPSLFAARPRDPGGHARRPPGCRTMVLHNSSSCGAGCTLRQ